MNKFNRLVSEQMITMEQLLYLQTELDRYQKIENESNAESLQIEIVRIKKELKEIQKIFEKQIEEVIQSYKDMKVNQCS